ncbi:MAG: hypothetical protein CL928_19160 [Deltaproteobacteria bacterium]|nr:hypothetical protein [Deltaproteobacteria bacterium]
MTPMPSFPDGNRPSWGEFEAPFMENVHGANGWAWVSTIGGSPRDFPGIGGVIGETGLELRPSAATVVLDDTQPLNGLREIAGVCREARKLDGQRLALARRLPASGLDLNEAGNRESPNPDAYWSQTCPGCPGAPTEEDLAKREDDSALERHALAGVRLAVLGPPEGQGSWEPGRLRSKLLREVFRPPHPDFSILKGGREAARQRNRELHLTATLSMASGLHSIWSVAGMLDLVTLDERAGGAPVSPSIGMAHAKVLRARGKRSLRPAPTGTGDEAVVDTALHLLGGGSFLATEGSVPSAPVRAAIALAQEHPELLYMRAGRVGLYYSLASAKAAALAGSDAVNEEFMATAKILDELHIPYKVVFAGDGIWVDNAFDMERLGLYDLVIVPRGTHLQDAEYKALGEAARVASLLVSGPVGTHRLDGTPANRAPLASGAGDRLFQLDGSAAQLVVQPSAAGRAALEETLLSALNKQSSPLPPRVVTDVPPSVLVERFMDPRSHLLTHHFVNLDVVAQTNSVRKLEGHILRVPAWPRQHGGQFEVHGYSPEQRKAQVLDYTWLSESEEVEIRLPPLGAWTSVSVRPKLPQRGTAAGPGRLRIDPPTVDENSQGEGVNQMMFDVPWWWGGNRKLTLSAPEEIFSANNIPDLGQNLVPSWDYAPDGSRLTLTATNQFVHVTVEARVVEPDAVSVNTTIKNQHSERLRRVEAMFCLDPGDLGQFPDSGLDRNYVRRQGEDVALGNDRHFSGTPLFSEGTDFDVPLTVLESVDDLWSLGHAYQNSQTLGANGAGGGVCIHTLPRFGSINPGESQSLSGRIYMASGRAGDLLDRFVADPPFPMEVPQPDPNRAKGPVCLLGREGG